MERSVVAGFWPGSSFSLCFQRSGSDNQPPGGNGGRAPGRDRLSNKEVKKIRSAVGWRLADAVRRSDRKKRVGLLEQKIQLGG
jgi:hypothetical protein